MKKRKGSCLCQSNQFETIGDPLRNGICYCKYCQLRTGSAFGVTYWFENKKVKFLKKKNFSKYSFTTESGNLFSIFSCKKCSTSVFWTISSFPNEIAIASGLYEGKSFWKKFEKEIFTRSKPSFLKKICSIYFKTSPTYKPIKKEKKFLKG